MYRPSLRSNWSLATLAILSLVLFYFAQTSKKTIKASHYDLKVKAANEMQSMMDVVKTAYESEELNYNVLDDPNKTGLIGRKVTTITTSRGLLYDKQTAINPNFAAIYVEQLKQARVKKGDYIAIGLTGSTPASNIALFAAIKVIGAKPVIITANGSAMYGANRENFTWLDIERFLNEKGLIDFKSSYASFGGNEDKGKGLSEVGLENLANSIVRNNVKLINGKNLRESIKLREEAYQNSIPEGKRFKAFVNIGSGLANVGSAVNAKLVKSGVNRKLAEKEFSNPGVMFSFAKKGIPVIHTYRAQPLAEKYEMPVAVSKSEKPFELQTPGEGMIFRSVVNNPFVIAICFVILLVSIIAVVAFDRHDRKFAKNIVAHED